MRHLKLEVLARLVDEAPEPTEARHLAECEACQGELEALKRQTEALGTLPKLAPAPDAWSSIRHRLEEEGLIRRRSRWAGPTLVRIAAALAVFLTGGAAGYAARGVAEPPAAVADGTEAVAETGGEAGTAAGPETLARAPSSGPATAPAASPMELTEDVERTEEMFLAALDRYMQASGMEAPDPAARLAVLDNIVLTTAAALDESPADPVINSFHLTAVAQQRELRRQLRATGDPVF